MILVSPDRRIPRGQRLSGLGRPWPALAIDASVAAPGNRNRHGTGIFNPECAAYASPQNPAESPCVRRARGPDRPDGPDHGLLTAPRREFRHDRLKWGGFDHNQYLT